MGQIVSDGHPCGISDGEGGCNPERIVSLLSEDTARELYRYADGPTTVGKFAEGLELPLSTTYRTISRLEDAGLLRSVSRTDPARYVRAADHVSVSYDDSIRISCVRGGVPLYCDL
ncbi:winged helix-turn-helix domain-containing protein [Natronosalvus caseinilyticus]|uniref:winged helix-turn-helix domain-containing protein n=1 Tax=Natronosalvus caseinilyticus TaxID=2953747 RepID=UPI0028A8B386|nr:helix-turn-helix domain-containing protein [Natronosalvus caseinilyticus]